MPSVRSKYGEEIGGAEENVNFDLDQPDLNDNLLREDSNDLMTTENATGQDFKHKTVHC